MKRLNCLIIFLILNIGLVLSLGVQTPLVCGGDDETIIMCLGDEELSFLGYDVPGEGEGEGDDTAPRETHTEPEPTPPIVLEPFLLFGIIDISFLRSYGLEPGDLWLIYGILVIFILCLFLWLRKRKCDKCKKRFKRIDLIRYKEKCYCEKCLRGMKN